MLEGFYPIKVAHIKTPFLPYSETFIYNYISGLKKYKPHIITEYQINKKQFPVDFSITHRSAKEWYEPIILNLRNWLAGRIQRELIFTNFYLKALKNVRPDVVHIHFGVPGLLLFREVRKLNLPLVVSFYGYDLSQIPYELGEDVYQRNGLFKHGQVFTAEGNFARNRLIQLGCSKEKASLLRIGIDLSKYKYYSRKLLDTKPIKILFCGRFIEKKGLFIALKSIAKAINLGHSIFFNIIGDGPQKKDALSLVNQLGIRKFVNFLGQVDHSTFIKQCYNNHLFIAPSQTDKITHESEGGAPTVLIESQATGMAVIATKHADIPEIIVHKKGGLLVDEGNIYEMCNAIIEFIHNPHLLNKMGINGLNHIIKQHDINIVNKRLEDLYDQAINMKKME